MMLSLLKAELRRLMTRWPRWIILACIFAGILGAQFFQIQEGGPGFASLLNFTSNPATRLAPLVL
ncbi:MAG: hypothetical protein HUJ54_11860 [Erysipelotrichaceae bacterium]|nr:hypothetical protein [Erysipelotrichaceae bacterium]